MSKVEFLKRVYASFVDRVCSQRIVFHHVPKCGGTSVARAIRMRYLPSQATVLPDPSAQSLGILRKDLTGEDLERAVERFREQVFVYLLCSDVRCVSAHVPFSEAAYAFFEDRYKFVTILRQPEHRYISNYFWNLGRGGIRGLTDDLDTFVETPAGARYGAIYSEYFSGLPTTADLTSEEAIERAKRNLKRFSVVGILEDINGFQRQLRECIGSNFRIAHENKSWASAASRRLELAPELRRRIDERCAPDREIYDWARSLGGKE